MSQLIDKESLVAIAKHLTQPGKGILASDESIGTIGKRLEKAGLENTAETRRSYRELFYTAPLGASVAGAILFTEALGQSASDGRTFVQCLRDQGVYPGIKVDEGLEVVPGTDGETHTKGMGTLRERCVGYKAQGAMFAKWRAALKVSDTCPTDAIIEQNARELAEYASVCQSVSIVPIVEPEILIDGPHDMQRFADVSERVLAICISHLHQRGVFLEGCLIKPQMIISGTEYTGPRPDALTVARETLRVLRRTIPPAIPGIMFLSGGMSEEDATVNLNAINQLKQGEGLAPWHLSFSFGRALQASVLRTWAGKPENAAAARDMAAALARVNGLAAAGQYAGPHPSVLEGGLHETFRGWAGGDVAKKA